MTRKLSPETLAAYDKVRETDWLNLAFIEIDALTDSEFEALEKVLLQTANHMDILKTLVARAIAKYQPDAHPPVPSTHEHAPIIACTGGKSVECVLPDGHGGIHRPASYYIYLDPVRAAEEKK